MSKEANVIYTYTVEVSEWTYKQKDLVFHQTVRQLVEKFSDELPNEMIAEILDQEATHARYATPKAKS